MINIKQPVERLYLGSNTDAPIKVLFNSSLSTEVNKTLRPEPHVKPANDAIIPAIGFRLPCRNNKAPIGIKII